MKTHEPIFRTIAFLVCGICLATADSQASVTAREKAPESAAVTATDEAPVAYRTNVAVNSGGTVVIELFGSDAEGAPLSYRIVDAPTHGMIRRRGGRVTYAPQAGFSGRDRFTYAIDAAGASSATETVFIAVAPQALLDRAETPQFGVNFVPFYANETLEPDAAFADFANLGADTYRQAGDGDVYWGEIERRDGLFEFTGPDGTLTRGGTEPIATLFRLQYASPTPPWETDPARFQKSFGEEARDYVDTTVERYRDVVRYWEIGNEMSHWIAADGGTQPDENIPCYPLDGYSPEEQAAFLRDAAEEIRAVDPDAVIVLPGLAGLNGTARDWLERVIAAAGSDWFDVVNYHYYGEWSRFDAQRAELQAFLENLGIGDKPVWMTETGSSSSPDNVQRTDYPNSDETQAADVFRLAFQAYGHGESLAMWHSYWDNVDDPTAEFYAYGLRDADSVKPSYHAARLMTEELLPFRQVTVLASDPASIMAYKVVTAAGETRYVAWGQGGWTVPDGVTQAVSVATEVDGAYVWNGVNAGEMLELDAIPVILK